MSKLPVHQRPCRNLQRGQPIRLHRPGSGPFRPYPCLQAAIAPSRMDAPRPPLETVRGMGLGDQPRRICGGAPRQMIGKGQHIPRQHPPHQSRTDRNGPAPNRAEICATERETPAPSASLRACGYSQRGLTTSSVHSTVPPCRHRTR